MLRPACPGGPDWAQRGIVAWALAAILVLTLPGATRADPPVEPPSELKKLSLDELFQLEVTSVSKTPERLSQTASAIQVITGEDIHRSGATTLPEALRLAANLEVAQVSAHDWGITARGFNGAPLSSGSLADKLLVLIDGRSVYSSLFGGVYWDVQNVMLEDVDRIEVISGPGGTLWGANAVNGVINVVTKSARETRRGLATVSAGSQLRDHGALRWGGRAGENVFFRAWGQRIDRYDSRRPDGTVGTDAWGLTQGGFRVDGSPPGPDAWTLEGDAYGGREGRPTSTSVTGQDVVGHWTRTLSATSDLDLRAYFDRTWRDFPISRYHDELRTWDVDFQHRVGLGDRHTLLWGVGGRLQRHITHSTPPTFEPATRTLHLFSAFVQDQVALVPERLGLTVGSKLEHNVYSKFDVQPGVRLAWTPDARRTFWAAVSRAVRSPSRFDVDFVSPGFTGNPDFASEKMTAYELGARARPVPRASLSVATFVNQYDDVRTIDVVSAAPPVYIFANDQEARTRGVEVTGTLEATPAWRVSAGYAYLHERFTARSPAVYAGSDRIEATDPRHRAQFQSSMDFGPHVQFDLAARYVDALPASVATPRVPAYGTLDARLGWRLGTFEAALVGQDLWDDRHPEFGVVNIPPSVHATLSCGF